MRLPIFSRSALFVIVSFGALAPVCAQNDLPHALSPSEIPLIRPYRDSRASNSRGITTPPSFPVRTMAEWEEIQSVVITWTSFPGILKQIVRHAKEECEVIIATGNSAQVISYLQGPDYGGPIDDLNGITFLDADFNSIWSRDYMAETIYANEVDSLYLLDWIYNRPRPDDDDLSDAVGAAKNIVVYSTTQAPYDLVHTGGNFMCDGAGTAFSSELVLDENGANGQYNQTVRYAAGVDAIMEQFMGIQQGRYIKMPALPYDGISHIDMHMKLLDEETLLVGSFPIGVSDGPQLESNVQAITDNAVSTFGDPYKLVRIPMPPSTGGAYPPSASYRTFANNVFLNGTVLVPIYREEYDSTGLRILRESLPGYKVIGIDCDSEQNIIQQSGAIHCITKTIGVADPLLIRHQPLPDTYNTTDPYMVEAYIRHRSGIATAQLYWTTDTSAGFTAAVMNDLGNGNWSGAIPAQLAGSNVFYYVQATANNGKVQVRPIVAPAGWWRFRVLDVNTSIQNANGPVITEIYPNPVSSLLTITLEQTKGMVQVDLMDALGRIAMPIYNGVMPSDGRLFLDVSELAVGPYVLAVRTAEGRSTVRVVKR
ncbi:MAG: agmatine deiminase family protein [Flavobacteriales bacterium]|nr:agmatine deiminase family protein [Flavobacteriales bacterium]